MWKIGEIEGWTWEDLLSYFAECTYEISKTSHRETQAHVEGEWEGGFIYFLTYGILHLICIE